MSEREQAIRWASEYMAQYHARLRIPRLPHNIVAFYTGRVKALTHEIGMMQAQGDEGDRLARMWHKVVPLG